VIGRGPPLAVSVRRIKIVLPAGCSAPIVIRNAVAVQDRRSLGRHQYAPCYSQEYAGVVNIY
jgi:hypothetical protein